MGTRQSTICQIIKAYDLKKLDEISFREDLVKTLDATKSTNQSAGSKFKLNIEFIKVFPSWMQEMKRSINKKKRGPDLS